VFSYLRRAGDDHAVVVMNLTPVPHDHYRIGVPEWGEYLLALSSDDQRWGGSGYGATDRVRVDDIPWHDRRYSVELTLPPLAVLVLVPSRLAGTVTPPGSLE
jgi:1,4-alpha-glucan branching enzyme